MKKFSSIMMLAWDCLISKKYSNCEDFGLAVYRNTPEANTALGRPAIVIEQTHQKFHHHRHIVLLFGHFFRMYHARLSFEIRT